MQTELFKEMAQSILDGDDEEAAALAERSIKEGINPLDAINQGFVLGVNEVGNESANDLICMGGDIPWLQDTAAAAVWTAWAVTYRDVIVLNKDNEIGNVFNLTTHDLGNAANYDELKSRIRTVVAESVAP